jgi:hypothetical protein
MTSKAFANAVDASAQQGGRRNLIINGAMQVAQRGTSVSMSDNSNEGYNTVDRFYNNIGSASSIAATVSQSTDAPDGFANSLKYEVTSAITSFAGTEFSLIQQRFEGQDLQHLKYGTSSAQDLTLSFWVKSNKTGTYVINFINEDNNRMRSETYTINDSNTWEYKTITIDGDTVGALDNDNEHSFRFNMWLVAGPTYASGSLDSSWGSISAGNNAVGQTNLYDTVGNTFQITGVQLEVGSVATPFEHRSYGEELALCQRYFYLFDPSSTTMFPATRFGGGSIGFTLNAPVTMRASPSYSNSGGSGQFYLRGNGAGEGFDNPNLASFGGNLVNLNKGGLTHNPSGSEAYIVYATVNADHYFDAEL